MITQNMVDECRTIFSCFNSAAYGRLSKKAELFMVWRSIQKDPLALEPRIRKQ